jgi:hypothetical protein
MRAAAWVDGRSPRFANGTTGRRDFLQLHLRRISFVVINCRSAGLGAVRLR